VVAAGKPYGRSHDALRPSAGDARPFHAKGEIVLRDRYWLGDGPAELEHLTAQAEVYGREADELLDLIGVEDGAHAIDLGCGVLGILPQLCRRVGAGGRVVGLDLEPRLLAAASDLAAARGLTVETVHADATATGLPPASFDLVHARTLLLNLTDPEAAVAEMARLARSGGIVALQEPDTAGWVCDPPHPAFDRLRTELVAMYPRMGKDFDIGRRTARLLRDAGLRDVQARATARVTRPGDYYQTFLLTLCALLRDPLLAGGALTPRELDRDVAELREHLSAPDTLTCQPLLWQAWGIKP
jgi:ubiquinone/menaquinone biosynthesis C-methylase UbiE